MHKLSSLLLVGGFAAGCSTPIPDTFSDAAPTQDPTVREVRLPCDSDWNASLVLDTAPTGIWTLGVMQVFPQYACPEVVGLDDRGRCHVMVSYSGKWTPVTTIADGEWLGGLAQGDVDPRVPGPELYTGGKRGNLYQVVTYREGVADNRRIAHLAGREIHTLVAADLDPERPGDELVAFTRPGGLFLLTPREQLDGFDARLVEELPGRVRDAAWIPGLGAIATVDRAGRLQLCTWTPDGPEWETVFEQSMGMGRLAVTEREGRAVLYTTGDDGSVWRHGQLEAGDWGHELIYAGPQGPRGLVCGAFAQDPAAETVAVFGYSGKVELLTRGGESWSAETIFEDRDKGHWLARGELDGRNATDEIVLSGYGARIVLLSRPPGYGRAGVLSER